MSESRNYRYYVEPLDDNSTEQIATYLNNLGEAAFTSEHQKIKVKGRDVYGVYEISHSMLTKISKTEHLAKVRIYVQEGVGEIRPYNNFTKRLSRLGRTRAIKTVRGAIRKMR